MLVLIVEDNRDLAGNIVEFLEYEGIECDWASRGDEGLALATAQPFDAIVLDLNLPRMDGIDVCRQLRAKNIHTPVLMLTARSDLSHKLEGFDVGANDYLVKPFDLPELHARLKALTNRGAPNGACLQAEDLHVDLGSRYVTRAGQPLQLNRIQWTILTQLMRCSPNIVPRETLEKEIWGEEKPTTDALKIHLHQLRSIVDKPFPDKLIHTFRGVGVALRKQEGK